MTFSEISKDLTSDKLIKRLSKDFYIFIHSSKKGELSIRSGNHSRHTPYRISVPDLYAIDWEVVEE